MFQFPRCPPSSRWVPGRAPGGLPHSDIPGSPAASASPGHFAAWPRPSSAANAKASTMRPSCGCPAPRPLRSPSSARPQTGARQRDGPVRPRRLGPLPRVCGARQCPVGVGTRFISRVLCVLCVLRVSARGRAATSPQGLRRLPRPQNPAGSAWRIVKVHPTTNVVSRPEGRLTTHVVARSSNLVRSRLPTSDELSRPLVVRRPPLA
jgi:hypothetical protein